MAKDIIMFDSNSELPWELQEQFQAPYVRMPYIPVSYTHLDVYKRQILLSMDMDIAVIWQSPLLSCPS